MHSLSETDRKSILELARQAVVEAVLPTNVYWKKFRRQQYSNRTAGYL